VANGENIAVVVSARNKATDEIGSHVEQGPPRGWIMQRILSYLRNINSMPMAMSISQRNLKGLVKLFEG